MSLYVDTAFNISLNGYSAEIYVIDQFMSDDKFYAMPINYRIKLIKSNKYAVKIVFEKHGKPVDTQVLNFHNLDRCYQFINDFLESSRDSSPVALNEMLYLAGIYDTIGEIE